MKTIKTLLSTTFLAVFFSMGASAQTNVNVTADVVDALVLTPVAVSIGQIQLNTASYLKANANDETATANVGTSASAGSLTIAGTQGATVSVSFTSATLSNGAGTPVTAAFTPTVYFGSSPVTSGNAITLGASTVLNIGGALASIGTVGSYSTASTGGSPITFTVSYN